MDSSERIIPRERLTAYERWELGALQGATTGMRSTPARNPAPASHESLERAASAAREKGHAEGFEEGRAEGHAAGAAEYAAACEQINAIAQSLGGAADVIGERLAERMLTLALTIARQVVRAELSLSIEAVLPAVHEAVALLPEATRDARVRVSPGDAPIVEAALAETVATHGWKIVPDAAITAGGCVIESASGEADARMETRWQQVLGSLGIHPAAHADNRR